MRIKNWKETVITCFSLLVSGFLNGHTQVDMGIFVGPQTGNVVNLGLNLANGDGEMWMRNLINFLSFIAGCALATILIRKLNSKSKQFMVGWTILTVATIGFILFQSDLPINLNVFVMSVVSGITLCFFRKIGHVELNNVVVTGNMRSIAMSAVDTFGFKNEKSFSTFVVIAMGVFFFFLGALLFGIANRWGGNSVLFAGMFLCFVPFLFMPRSSVN